MTALPLFWGEAGPAAVLQGPDQRADIIKALSADYQLVPLDILDEAKLGHIRLLMLAQPRGLSPEELVALDGWVRGGGKVLIFADPMLVWPSALPIGDRRRAPPVTLLDPLFGHWGLQLGDADHTRETGEIEGKTVAVVQAGSWRSRSPTCAVSDGGLVARCRIGKGKAILVADADVLADEQLRKSGTKNETAIAKSIERLDSGG